MTGRVPDIRRQQPSLANQVHVQDSGVRGFEIGQVDARLR
jgi:hypothetical protein